MAITYPPKMGLNGYYYATPAVETLVSMDRTGRILPLLATSWTLSPDGKSMTMNLRQGVKFHDGTDFNAEAAKWNLDNQTKEKTPTSTFWTSIDVVGPYTIRINMPQYNNSLLYNLAIYSPGMMTSPTAVQKNGMDWALKNIVGTGPFRMKTFTPDVSITYEKFDGYWQKGKPYLDGIEMIYIANPTTATISLQAGSIHALRGVAAETPKAAYDLQQAGFDVTSRRTMVLNLLPDSKNPDSPFADKKVREAVEYALDRPALVKALGYGIWDVTNQVSYLDNLSYNPDIIGRQYDPNKAKQLLAEAGRPTGFKTRIIMGPAKTNTDAMTAVQRMLGLVGIDAEIEVVNQGKYQSYQNEGWRNALLIADASLTLNYTTGVSRNFDAGYLYNVSTLRPAGWGDALNSAFAASDFATQKTLTQKLVRMLYDDATITPLWASPSYVAKQKNIAGDNLMVEDVFIWIPQDSWLTK
ncbi:MAG: hypothetical protein HYX87_07435 [Chloroflexi bacterium]|nr:hypothetical protein [Chloroflexota bacterium]